MACDNVTYLKCLFKGPDHVSIRLNLVVPGSIRRVWKSCRTIAACSSKCKLMISDNVQCLGKAASNASISSEDVKVEDLPLHQKPVEAYVDFGGRFTRSQDGKHLVVLRAELLTDREGRVSSSAAFQRSIVALTVGALSQWPSQHA